MTEAEAPVTTEDEQEPGPDLTVNVAYQCAMKGSITRLITCFDSEEDPYHEVGVFGLWVGLIV